jgi:hypothetical protein
MEKIYTCHPIQKLSFGLKFKFDKGMMILRDKASIEEFDALLEKLPIANRRKVKTISLDIANKIAAAPRAIRGFDPGVNVETLKMQAENPKIGTENLGAKDNTGNQGESAAKALFGAKKPEVEGPAE